MQDPRPHRGPIRFFFMHLGTLLGFAVYIVLGEQSGWSAPGVTRALWAALAVHSAYVVAAASFGELKQFDLGLWILFAIGVAAAHSGADAIFELYRRYAGALLFAALASTAVIPLLLGREPFTVYHGKRQTPRWQWQTQTFRDVNRVMALFWAAIFVAAAALCAARPTDPTFTLLLPNALVVGVGMVLGRRVPDLWMRRFPAPMPDRAGPLIMGMPFAFDPAAAGNERAVIQFHVRGDEPGDYWVRVDGGRCESFEGTTPEPDLTIHTPGAVWVEIAHGRLDGAQALLENRYRVEGKAGLLTAFPKWFGGRG